MWGLSPLWWGSPLWVAGGISDAPCQVHDVGFHRFGDRFLGHGIPQNGIGSPDALPLDLPESEAARRRRAFLGIQRVLRLGHQRRAAFRAVPHGLVGIR